MLKIVLIGCGRISHKHIQAMVENKNDLSLVALCDSIKERAMERAREYTESIGGINVAQILIFDNYSKMLQEVDFDIAAIATESGSHAEIAKECINQGKHVIIEKPMALSISDAEAMIEAASLNQVKVGVCHQNRFNPSIQKLRQALEEGRFGKIIAGDVRVLWNRGQDYYQQAAWRGTYDQDGGCLMNQCIHGIDLLQWMLGGQICWVHGDVSNYTHPYNEAEDYGSIQIKFRDGAVGNVEGTVCVYPENLEETVTIIGEKGIAVVGGLAANEIKTWRFEDAMDNEEEIKKLYNREVENVYGNGHIPLYMDMVMSIKEDREPYISGMEGKKAMEIILAAYKSNQEGRRIGFPTRDISTKEFIKAKHKIDPMK